VTTPFGLCWKSFIVDDTTSLSGNNEYGGGLTISFDSIKEILFGVGATTLLTNILGCE